MQNFREIELKINKNFYLICALVTIIAILTSLIQFFTRGAFPPSGIHFFYIGILLLYALHKEFLRWVGEKGVERQGEIFVYVWIGITTILYLINFLTKNYFSYSPRGEGLDTLKEISIMTLEVVAIFVIARLSKMIKFLSEKR
jgi:hypothetical protein